MQMTAPYDFSDLANHSYQQPVGNTRALAQSCLGHRLSINMARHEMAALPKSSPGLMSEGRASKAVTSPSTLAGDAFKAASTWKALCARHSTFPAVPHSDCQQPTGAWLN